MARLRIVGGNQLNGTVDTSGAKNAVLPLLAACIMLDGDTRIVNVPKLKDVSIMVRMLASLNIRAEFREEKNEVTIRNQRKINHIVPYELVTAMRASFFVAGPLLAKLGYAKIPLPGGCSIGARPVDIHLKGFEALGAKIEMEHGFVSLQANRLKGCPIRLDFPSVGATENLMMAACLAEGETIIRNAALEPEITDLGEFLIAAGARIDGLGTSTLTIQGVERLSGVDTYSVIPDRVEAGTLLIAGAITGGDVRVNKLNVPHLDPLLEIFHLSGIHVETGDDWARVKGNGSHKAVDVETQPFPGFPTDMQAQVMTMLSLAEGNSLIKETVFENRFMHARELMRMGAKIKIDRHHAEVSGVKTLSGAEVEITDLRAGAALVLAGLVADGYTTVYGVKHLVRGYDDLPKKLRSLGADIQEIGTKDNV